MLSYAMPRPAPKLRLSNHRGHFRGGRLRVSESRRMVNHGPNPKSQVVVGAGGRKYTPLEQNLKGTENAKVRSSAMAHDIC